MSDIGLAKGYAAVVGVVLVVIGLLGFIANPIVGDPTATSTPLLVTGPIHNVVHLATGALALYIAFAMKGASQASALIGFGALYVVLLLLTLISPTLFGVFNYSVSILDHGLHLALGLASIGVGYLARNQLTPAIR